MKMNLFDDLSNGSKYQFSRWSRSMSRPHSSLPSKDPINDMSKLNIDNRNQVQRPDSSSTTTTTKRIIKHHVRIPTDTRLVSPPPLNQPTSTPDVKTKLFRSSTLPKNCRLYRPIPFRLKSTALTMPISKINEEISLQNFPKENHEQRKITGERKRRRQQAQILADKYAETDTWFQLRRSLGELKRLAITQDILIDPTTSFLNCDGYSFTALKQVINEEDKKAVIFNSESIESMPRPTENNENRFNHPSYMSSSFGSTVSSHELARPSLISHSSFSRPRTPKRSTETYQRLIFEPLIVTSKPIHPLLLTDNHNSPLKSRIKPPVSPLSRSRPNTTPLSEQKRAQLLLSDLSNDDNPPKSPTPSPPLVKIEREIFPRKILTPSPTRVRPPSSIQLSSTIKLKAQIPRCHSATDIKSSSSTTKNYPRFILIADQEHRIESWYHQYPFIHSDDLLTSFQSKELQQKTTVLAFFIDDLQSLNPNITAKTFLQGKSFHINNDWKKYDLIFISNNIYEQIIIYLQEIINLSEKIIKIYQINHEEDLKRQVKNICKQLHQQNIS